MGNKSINTRQILAHFHRKMYGVQKGNKKSHSIVACDGFYDAMKKVSFHCSFNIPSANLRIRFQFKTSLGRWTFKKKNLCWDTDSITAFLAIRFVCPFFVCVPCFIYSSFVSNNNCSNVTELWRKLLSLSIVTVFESLFTFSTSA